MTTRSEWRERRSGESTRYGTIGLLVLDAMDGKARAIHELVEKLQQPDFTRELTPDDFGWLAYLVDKKMSRNGRRRGSLKPENAATLYAGYLFREGKRFSRRKHGRKRARDKTLNDKMLKRAIELIEVAIPEARGRVSEEDVKAASNLTPSAEVVEIVHEDLSDQLEQVIKIALEEE